MEDESKRKLRRTTVIYWVLLTYIIAALFWWFFSLYTQNRTMYELRLQDLEIRSQPGSSEYIKEKTRIRSWLKRNNAKYIGEGITFLVLMVFGAVYVYRSVRRQLSMQQQQQNFVMAITHELKTPLSVARLNLETLQRHHLDESRKEKLLQMTLQETLRLDSLINNILISSQLEGESYRSTKEDLNLSALVQDVVQQFTARYPDRSVILDIAEDIDMVADPLLLKLLVSNLLENANKYSERLKPVYLSLRKDTRSVILEVRDEGEGISREERKNVFRKFYRIGNEQNRRTKGTGLGLYLCKKITRDHDGDIRIEDNQPQGSKFIVNFPV